MRGELERGVPASRARARGTGIASAFSALALRLSRRCTCTALERLHARRAHPASRTKEELVMMIDRRGPRARPRARARADRRARRGRRRVAPVPHRPRALALEVVVDEVESGVEIVTRALGVLGIPCEVSVALRRRERLVSRRRRSLLPARLGRRLRVHLRATCGQAERERDGAVDHELDADVEAQHP